MPLEDILSLPSIDSDGIFLANVLGCTFGNSTVRNAIRYKRLNEHKKQLYYVALTEHMRRERINAVPIHIGYAADMAPLYAVSLPAEIEPEQLMMGNGHHRVLIAVKLRLPEMRWTDNLRESGWP